MNSTIEREIALRRSEMDYSIKAGNYLCGGYRTPCLNCSLKGDNPAGSILERTKICFEKCTFEIMIWLLSDEQNRLYEEVRPKTMKERDVQKAITKKRFIMEENFVGRKKQ